MSDKVPLRKLRSWHRRLSTLHSKACVIADEANAALGEDDQSAIIINDPIIELHAALSCIEGMIGEHTNQDPHP